MTYCTDPIGIEESKNVHGNMYVIIINKGTGYFYNAVAIFNDFIKLFCDRRTSPLKILAVLPGFQRIRNTGSHINRPEKDLFREGDTIVKGLQVPRLFSRLR